MNRSLRKRSLMQVLIWSGVVVLSAATAYARDPAAAGGQRSDGQIEMDVVHALDASQALKNDLITAATIQSEVTLAGTVSTDASKKLAESIVSKVAGVTKVHNNLTIGNPQDAQNGPAPQAADDNDQERSSRRMLSRIMARRHRRKPIRSSLHRRRGKMAIKGNTRSPLLRRGNTLISSIRSRLLRSRVNIRRRIRLRGLGTDIRRLRNSRATTSLRHPRTSSQRAL